MDQDEERTERQGGEPAGERAPATNLEKQLEEVSRQLEEQAEAARSADEKLQGATRERNQEEARRKALEDRKKALAQLVSQMEAVKASLDQRRQAAQKVQQGAEEGHAELIEDLQAELSEAYRQHIDGAIADEKQKTGDLRDEVDGLEQEAQAAEKAKAEAQARVTQAEMASRTAQTGLQQLGGRIQAAVSEVTQARQAAAAADQKGQAGEAYFLAHELKAAIERLAEVSDPRAEQDLREAMNKHWQAAVAAREELAVAQQDLDASKARLQAKQSALQAAEKQWAANVQQKVRDFPEDGRRP